MNMKKLFALLFCLCLSLCVVSAMAASHDPVTHTEWVWKDEVPATCTLAGVQKLVCKKCWDNGVETVFKYDVKPATGHKWVKDGNLQPATCAYPAYVGYYCTNPGCWEHSWVEDTTKPATGKHVFEYVSTSGTTKDKKQAIKNAPTCTEAAYWTKICVTCYDKTEKEYSTDKADKALGHDLLTDYWWIGTRPATCSEEGFGRQYCSRCDYEEFGTIKKLDHTPVAVAAKDATCEEDGNKAGKKCSVCDTVLSGCEKLPKLGHDYVETTPEVPATCTATGTTAVKTCSRCGKTDGGKTIAALGHEWKFVNADEGWGKPTYLCIRCGITQDAASGQCIANAAHKKTWKLTKTIKEPTCTAAGVGIYTCATCGLESGEVSIAPKGHTKVTVKVEGNKKLVACFYCDYSVWEAASAADVHQHTWCNVKQLAPATCVKGAVWFQGCYTCDATRNFTDKTKGGHTIIDYQGQKVCYYCDYVQK